MSGASELDRIVFERLPAFTPFWMADEGKWLVGFANEYEWEVERFLTKEDAYAFCKERQP